MGLVRSALLALVGWLFWRVYKKVSEEVQPEQKDANNSLSKGNMLRCAHCGLYIPEDETIKWGNTVFCCHEHQQLYALKQSAPKQ